jgi:hypothetical protein
MNADPVKFSCTANKGRDGAQVENRFLVRNTTVDDDVIM